MADIHAFTISYKGVGTSGYSREKLGKLLPMVQCQQSSLSGTLCRMPLVIKKTECRVD